jgi:hypothetical protein
LASALNKRALGALDALRLATGRGQPDEIGDLLPVADALGLVRAHSEGLAGADAWLARDPAAGLADALMTLFQPATAQRIDDVSDIKLDRARRVAIGLEQVLLGAGELMRLAYPAGAGGLGLLWEASSRREGRPLLAYLGVVHPDSAAALADAFTPGQISEWIRDATLGRAWLEEHPELRPDVAARGLTAVLTDWIARRDADDRHMRREKWGKEAPKT